MRVAGFDLHAWLGQTIEVLQLRANLCPKKSSPDLINMAEVVLSYSLRKKGSSRQVRVGSTTDFSLQNAVG
jgi:hypothetical protein